MQGFALTQEQIIEVLSVYATAEQYIEAVTATPGWYVIGAFPMPANADIRIDVIGSVSNVALALRVRLYDITTGSTGAVSGSVAQLGTTIDSQAFSGNMSLIGGHTYQFQVEVTGATGSGYFGVVRRATLAGA